jgi:hypothetical protein
MSSVVSLSSLLGTLHVAKEECVIVLVSAEFAETSSGKLAETNQMLLSFRKKFQKTTGMQGQQLTGTSGNHVESGTEKRFLQCATSN